MDKDPQKTICPAKHFTLLFVVTEFDHRYDQSRKACSCKRIRYASHEVCVKGRVSRFSACASDDLSAVKIIDFRPIRSAFTTLAGHGGKLLQLVVDSIQNDRPSTTAASC